VDIISKKEAINLGLSRFYTGIECKNGHLSERYSKRGSCVECVIAQSTKWANDNPGKRKKIYQKYGKDNREKCNKSKYDWIERNKIQYKKIQKDWRENNKEKIRGYKNLPIPTHEYPKDGLCECCGSVETFKHKSSQGIHTLSLDHCHNSGEFRGWICNSCNRTLGVSYESISRLRKAANYLEDSQDQEFACY
jgi:hypothetical protein